MVMHCGSQKVRYTLFLLLLAGSGNSLSIAINSDETISSEDNT